MPITPEFIEYGTLGLAIVILQRSLDFALAVSKAKKEAKADPSPEDPNADRRLAQSLANAASIKRIETMFIRVEKSVTRIERVVIDGNGKPGLVTQVAVMSEQMTAHVSSDHLHK